MVSCRLSRRDEHQACFCPELCHRCTPNDVRFATMLINYCLRLRASASASLRWTCDVVMAGGS